MALLGLASPFLSACMKRLPPPPGIKRGRGEILVNGQPAPAGTPTSLGDRIETGPQGEALFVIGDNAFLLRESGRLDLTGKTALEGFTLHKGALLSVFGTGVKILRTPTATVGIRGTGVYLEARSDSTYACTCYGTADLAARENPAIRETVVTEHHDAPRIIRPHDAGWRIEAAPVVNHTDAELILLESLVGREPPFVATGNLESYRRSDPP